MAFVEPHEAGKWPSAFWAAFWLAIFSLPLLVGLADSGAPAPPQHSVLWLDSPPSAPAPEPEVKREPATKPAPQPKPKPKPAPVKKAAKPAPKPKKDLADIARRAEEKKEKEKIIAERKEREEERRRLREEREREKEKEAEEIDERKKLERRAAEELRQRKEAEEEEKRKRAAERKQAEALAKEQAATAERDRLASLFEVYVARIKTQIERKINRPAGLPFEADIEVTILIRVDADGFVIDDPLVWQSSHYPDFDAAAVRAVIQAQPLLVPKDEPKLLPEFRELRLVFSAGSF